MGAAFVISVVPARLLLISVFLLAACSPPASVHPSLSAKASASPSATAPTTPAPTVSGPLMLSAIQRLTSRWICLLLRLNGRLTFKYQLWRIDLVASFVPFCLSFDSSAYVR